VHSGATMDSLADVRSRDFLHRHAETPLCERYISAGAVCNLSTNSERILEAARGTFARIEEQDAAEKNEFSLRLWVDDSDRAQSPWPKPYVRGLDHVVYAGFDAKSSFLADLSARRVIGRFSPGMAEDLRYWKMTIFPMLMTIVSGAVGLLEVHASCVARGNDGLLILGPGRAGKSTLALAMAHAGFRVLSDDRTFCSLQDGSLQAYGLPRPLKIRHDAARWFEQFRSKEPRDVQNGEAVFYSEIVDSESEHCVPCEPKAVIFLQRCAEGDFLITRMRRSDVQSRIEADLLVEDPDALESQKPVFDKLLSLPAWHLQYSVEPHALAEQVGRFSRQGAS